MFCTNCGGRLDNRTGACPVCDAPAVTQPVIPAAPPTAGQGGGYVPPRRKEPLPVTKIVAGLVILVVVIIAALFMTGFFGSTPQIPGTPAPTVTVPPLTSAGVPVTKPTDRVPKDTEVYVQVLKNPSNKQISVVFAGGPGQRVIKELNIQVTRSTGQVETANLLSEQQNEATLTGSKGIDRVEVFAIHLSGQKYRIYDEALE